MSRFIGYPSSTCPVLPLSPSNSTHCYDSVSAACRQPDGSLRPAVLPRQTARRSTFRPKPQHILVFPVSKVHKPAHPAGQSERFSLPSERRAPRLPLHLRPSAPATPRITRTIPRPGRKHTGLYFVHSHGLAYPANTEAENHLANDSESGREWIWSNGCRGNPAIRRTTPVHRVFSVLLQRV